MFVPLKKCLVIMCLIVKPLTVTAVIAPRPLIVTVTSVTAQFIVGKIKYNIRNKSSKPDT